MNEGERETNSQDCFFGQDEKLAGLHTTEAGAHTFGSGIIDRQMADIQGRVTLCACVCVRGGGGGGGGDRRFTIIINKEGGNMVFDLLELQPNVAVQMICCGQREQEMACRSF